MTENNISLKKIRKAGNEKYYFVFRLPGDGMFVSIFFDSMSEIMAAVEYAQRMYTNDDCYLCNTKSEGDNYFVFLTKNYIPIGQSTIFEQAFKMNDGRHYMQKHLQRAEVENLIKSLFS